MIVACQKIEGVALFDDVVDLVVAIHLIKCSFKGLFGNNFIPLVNVCIKGVKCFLNDINF